MRLQIVRQNLATEQPNMHTCIHNFLTHTFIIISMHKMVISSAFAITCYNVKHIS